MMTSKRLDMTPHLTVGHDQGLTQCFAKSIEGMAHFAGTGPKDEQCKTCRHWGNGSGPKQRAQTRPCAKFVSMTGVESKGVPRRAAACRHFEMVAKRNGGAVDDCLLEN